MSDTLAGLFLEAAARHADRPAFKERADRGGHLWTYGALKERVVDTALGLSSLGVGPGDRVALFADNSSDWITTDLAVMALGAADVPRGTDTTPTELDFLIRHSNARVVVVSDRRHLDELAPVLADIADLRCIVLLEGSFRQGDPRPVLSIQEVRDRGRRLLRDGARLEEFVGRTRGGDVATVVYTSGTTGKPKGVVLTHENVLHNIRVVPSVVEFGADDVFLSILPAWHMFERLIEYAALSQGALTVYSSKRGFKQDLLRERPTVVAAVPRLYEMLYEEARKRLAEGPAPRRALVECLLRAAESYRGSCRLDPRTGRRERPWARLLAPVHAVADRMVFSRFRAALGGRLHTLVSGGGSLPRHIDAFFDAAGVPLLNGYGLTETAPLIAVRRRERPALGTVGPPIRGTEVEVRDPQDPAAGALPPGAVGVLHVRGPQVTQGYLHDRDATRRAFDERGFFDTGDLVRVWPTGDIEITGRAKDTIVLSGGENVEPEPIENQLRLSPLIEQVIVLGQDQKALGALIVPDQDALRARVPAPARAGSAGGADSVDAPDLDDPAVRAVFAAELERLVNRATGFKSFEQVRRFQLVATPFSVESGEATETLKLRRHVIVQARRDAVGALFAQ